MLRRRATSRAAAWTMTTTKACAVGEREREVDWVVRVVWPGPVMRWPRPHADVTEEELASGERAAMEAKDAWVNAWNGGSGSKGWASEGGWSADGAR
jgi:hypothetical protein